MHDRTDTRVNSRFTEVVVRAAELRVLAGPDAGTRVRVNGPTFTVGSGADAQLRLADGAVSREHFRLALGPNGVHLHDPGSKNGTWLGGVKVERVLLATDVTLTVGGTTIEIALDRQTSRLTLSESSSFDGAIGHSHAMRHVFAVLERAASTNNPLWVRCAPVNAPRS